MFGRFTFARRCGLILACLLIWLIPSAASALTADQILLLVNKNVPQGRTLAQLYTQKRAIPAGRILELSLPDGEEISFDQYERVVVPGVRDFLRAHQLEHKVTCIVTFYGVPIRIAPRIDSAADLKELADLKSQRIDLETRIAQDVQALQAAVGAESPATRPSTGDAQEFERLARAANAAMQVYRQRIGDPKTLADIDKKVASIAPDLIGGLMNEKRQMAADEFQKKFQTFKKDFMAMEDDRFDPADRQKLRGLAAENLNVFEQAKLLAAQIDYLSTAGTGAAFDNELAMVWWWDYPRVRWMVNPLNYRYKGRLSSPVMMTMRLDGPQTGTAAEIIDASLKAEQQGLKGQICIDSLGMPLIDKNGQHTGYGPYDESLRRLATLVRSKTKMSMTFDDKPEVLAAHSVKNVALYVGWYSVDKYIPACQFNTGAVAFHIASYTMVNLHRPDPRSWVQGLLNDGAAATLGPVAEPYLLAFPPADDFFPLLMTGKLTLAEVYWKTNTTTSWMINMIGDPLYNPYKVNPQISVNDLPPRLRAIFDAPAGAAPSASPGAGAASSPPAH
jgi:uncharacterized protein (TIGR03790 family)